MNDKETILLNAAIELFAEEGFWNTPTAKIAKHAGVSNGTLFNYFQTKNALIEAVYMKLKTELFQYMMQDIPSTRKIQPLLKHAYAKFIHWGIKYPDHFMLMDQMRLSNYISEQVKSDAFEMFAPLLEPFEQAIADGVLAEPRPGFLLSLIQAHEETAIKFALDKRIKKAELDDYIQTSFHLMWKGVSASSKAPALKK